MWLTTIMKGYQRKSVFVNMPTLGHDSKTGDASTVTNDIQWPKMPLGIEMDQSMVPHQAIGCCFTVGSYMWNFCRYSSSRDHRMTSSDQCPHQCRHCETERQISRCQFPPRSPGNTVAALERPSWCRPYAGQEDAVQICAMCAMVDACRSLLIDVELYYILLPLRMLYYFTCAYYIIPYEYPSKP